jgi:hypothetical protein
MHYSVHVMGMLRRAPISTSVISFCHLCDYAIGRKDVIGRRL